jgi:hypothetical protein
VQGDAVSTPEERREEMREEMRRGLQAGCLGCALGIDHAAAECAAEPDEDPRWRMEVGDTLEIVGHGRFRVLEAPDPTEEEPGVYSYRIEQAPGVDE